MTIHVDGPKKEAECNSCGECEVVEHEFFNAAVAELKQRGWTVMPIRRMGNIEWKHYCPKCSRM